MNKQILTVALAAAMLCSASASMLSASAAEAPHSSSAVLENVVSGVVSGDYTYSLNNGNATITAYSGTSTHVTIPSTIDDHTVTAIGNNAFYGKSITNVVIPGTVTSIGGYAFESTALTSVTIPASVTTIGREAFAYTQIAEVVVPNTVTSFGDYAFENNENLTKVTIGASAFSKSIYGNMFANCDELRTVVLDETVTVIPGSAFSGTILENITIPSTVTSIGDDAFKGTPVSNITLPADLKSIGIRAFYNCSNLTKIALPTKQLETIGSYAFESTPLTSVTIPGTVTSIGREAFAYTQLSKVTVPNTVKSFGDYVFENNEKLTEATLGASAFSKSIYGNMFANCGELRTIKLNSTVKVIPGSAFAGTILENITIPSTVTSIGDDAFKETPISNITLPADLKSIGIRAFYNCPNLTKIDLPTKQLESIGSYAFESTPLTGVTIPATVTKIGRETFAYTQIKEAAVPNTITSFGDYAFGYNENLTTAALGSSAFSKSIYGNMFAGCESLKNITLDETVTVIPGSAFAGSILENITIPDTVTAIGDDAFKGTPVDKITLPADLKSIGLRAFYNCSNLTKIDLPTKQLETIGSYAFESTPLTSITIPATVTSIGREAFAYTQISEVTVPNTVTSFGDYVFENNENLTTATIGGSAFSKSIYGNMFNGCEELKTVTMDNTVTTVPTGAFAGTIIEKADIPDSVTSIGDAAFKNTAISNVVLPDGITSIGSSAYYNCPNITDIDLPESLVTIGSYAFQSTSLKKVFIPSKVTTIGREAFADMETLETVFIPNSVTSIGYYTFNNCPNLTIVCYKGSAAETYAKNNNIPVKVLDPDMSPLVNKSTVSKTAVIQNSTITITGDAEGGSEVYEYRISYKRGGAKDFTVKSDFGKAASANLKLGYVDNYTIKVEVRDETGTIETKLFTVESLKKLADKSKLSADSIPAKASVTINYAADGGKGPYKYKLSYKRSTDKDFKVSSDYSTAASVKFTPYYVDTYTIRVDVKDSVGNTAYQEFTLKSTAALVNKSSVDKTTIEKGQTIKITGAAEGGKGTYQYRFLYKKSTAKEYTVKSDFGKATSVNLKLLYAATYNIRVEVKDSTGRVVTKDMDVVSTAIFENKATISSTNIQKGATLTIKGAAAGGSGSYEYRFSYKKSTAKDYTLKADYGKATSVKLAPGSVGTYLVKVDVKDTATGKELSTEFTVTVTEVLKNKSRIGIEYDDNDNAYVTVDGSASGGAGDYKYAFYYKKADDTNWTTKGTAFGNDSTAALTTESDVLYNIKVVVKDSAGNTAERKFTISVY